MTMQQQSPPESGRDIPVTERKYLVPMILITSLFFLWAIGVNLNDILIPHFKKIFRLTDLQSSFIQAAFFGGYFLAALPAGWLISRIGYKKGILTGLALCASGALLFIPAASASVYVYFLFALFIMASGQSFLEVAANPYITVLGPAESAARRLNLSQSFNAVGALVTPILGAAFILTANEFSASQLATMSPEQLQAFRIAEVHTVKAPYLLIAGIFLAVATMISFAKLPEIAAAGETAGTSANGGMRAALSHPQLVKGTIAQFFYVGAQVGVASFVIRFSQHIHPALSAKSAADYLKFHLLGFAIGRFLGSALMKRIPPPKLLSLFAAGSLICACIAVSFSNVASIWAIVLIGFFHSIMFPTIFALGIRNLGEYTKIGSSFLVMAIIGGAVFPIIMGSISDAYDIQRAFFVPLLCYAVILYFGLYGYRDTPEKTSALSASTSL